MTKDVAIAAAEWWSDKLRSCKNSGLSAAERADRQNDGYQLAEMLMTASKPKVTNEQVSLFKDTLVSRIMFEQPRYLGVDYGPDEILQDALDAAGVKGGMGTLPIKTGMWISDTEVKVGYGYGAPIQTIYPASFEKGKS